ncbi:MAG: hypothetical protein HRU70_13640 [Phycisphaeraceae bacterium]|nr:MAG: hypothetical protein HRU70_13640 [Phycisphaeraceae bacterium]
MLVICDGDLPGLVAAFSAREAYVAWVHADRAREQNRPPGPIIWHPTPPGHTEGFSPRTEHARRATSSAAMARAASLRFECPGPGSPVCPEVAHGSVSTHDDPAGLAWPHDGPAATCLLASACSAAVSMGRDGIVWPVQFESNGTPDIAPVSRAIDRALLVTRLWALDAWTHGRPGVHIETPYADLRDAQLAELALDLGVPVELCWWADAHEGGVGWAQRERWTRVLERAGWRPGTTADGVGSA